jgi:hypothetical protein
MLIDEFASREQWNKLKKVIANHMLEINIAIVTINLFKRNIFKTVIDNLFW